MGLLNKIFGQKTNTEKKGKDLPSFWEDDYCQIEIIPRQNVEYIIKSIKEIDDLTENTKSEYGFADIFIREDLPFPILNQEIRIDYFEKFLTEKGFEKAKQIRFDGHTIINCSRATSNAFSLYSFNFFYDCKGEFISNTWISTSLITSTDHFNKIKETLYELGEGCELVLIDWNSSELIDLTDKKQIEKYLINY